LGFKNYDPIEDTESKRKSHKGIGNKTSFKNYDPIEDTESKNLNMDSI